MRAMAGKGAFPPKVLRPMVEFSRQVFHWMFNSVKGSNTHVALPKVGSSTLNTHHHAGQPNHCSTLPEVATVA